ncbi:MAG TPA: hypothetical protein DCG57_02715 [Candidatus Riflebacteria bacterium]|jgi:drug/metabolite transporter (DMT)-like permease|nr:hypothetical protein [Candidatus Riflebacteria bacterium]
MQNRIKLELKTPLEQFFGALALLSPLFIFMGYQQMQLGDRPWLLLGSVIVFLCAAFSYFVTDNYYLLDLDKQGLFFRFKYLFIERLSLVTAFSGIHAVTLNVNAIRGKGSHNFTYYYVVTIVLFDGRVLPVTDMQQQRAEARKLADFIVKATGASLVENIGTSKMGAAKQGGRYTFKPLTYNDSGFNSIFAKIIAFIMIIVLSAFIGMTLYFFATR